MADDLVQRLRALSRYKCVDAIVAAEAADEIERLRADRDSWRNQASERVRDWDEMRQRAEHAEARIHNATITPPLIRATAYNKIVAALPASLPLLPSEWAGKRVALVLLDTEEAK